MALARARAAGLAAAALLAVAARAAASGGSYDGWSHGRATFYGDNDGMSIHGGSCMFGTLDGSKGTGWDIAALSDTAHDYAGAARRRAGPAAAPGPRCALHAHARGRAGGAARVAHCLAGGPPPSN